MLTWFIHFHKAAGSSVIEAARLNGETLPEDHRNGNLTSTEEPEAVLYHNKTREQFEKIIEGVLASKVTFVASEWDIPDLEYLLSHPRIQVVTILRHPTERFLSNLNYDLKRKYYRGPLNFFNYLGYDSGVKKAIELLKSLDFVGILENKGIEKLQKYLKWSKNAPRVNSTQQFKLKDCLKGFINSKKAVSKIIGSEPKFRKSWQTLDQFDQKLYTYFSDSRP